MPVRKADNLTTLSWNLGTSTSWNPQGLSRFVQGLLYLYILSVQRIIRTSLQLSQGTAIKMEGKTLTYFSLKVQVLWNVTPCQLINSYKRLKDNSAFIFRVKQSEQILPDFNLPQHLSEKLMISHSAKFTETSFRRFRTEMVLGKRGFLENLIPPQLVTKLTPFYGTR
jgi:hypothetical protein